MQKELLDFADEKLSRTIRNLSYEQILSDKITNIQRERIAQIIQMHPEGITDLEICILTGLSRSSVTGRRNEIPWVVPIGFAKIQGDNGENDRLNTLWGGHPPISCGTLKKE